VLVCVDDRSGGDYWEEIYDQHGNLLASTDWPSGQDSPSPVQELVPSATKAKAPRRAKALRELVRETYFDVGGQIQLSLTRDSKHRIGRALAIKATAPDGHEIGTVAIRGSSRGSIVSAGATVAYLKPPSVLGLVGLGPNRGRYTVYGADGSAVGRITRRRRFTEYAVIEIDQSVAEGLRALMPAASAAVKYWMNERAGGWLG
jgi:hypothetical protein